MNKQTITYALGVAAFLGAAALTPVLADTQLTGNGAFSNNVAQASSQNSTKATQSNTTQVTNTVTTNNNTGNNSANFNTGGTVVVQTGSANANVGISNTAGSNTAQVAGGSQGSQNTTVLGNGAFSNNAAQTSTGSNTSLQQANNTNVANTVSVNNNTGNNAANFNTGSTVVIGTGNANAEVGIENAAGSNQAAVNGASSNGQNGSSTLVAGNGAFSANNVGSTSNSSTSLSQTNNTNFANMVNENNNTGGNTENYNTGGNVGIFTGNANAYVGISNMAGQNTGYVQGGTGGGQGADAYILGNGAFSASNVSAWNSFRTDLKQENLTYVLNYVDTMNNTGNNAASFNTGGDTVLTTGDANAGTTIFNTAGSNEGYLIGGSYFANAAEFAILGNGAFSNNSISSSQVNRTSADQTNNTMFTNKVKTSNNAGNNKADYGTGGSSYLSPYMVYGNYGMNESQSGNANSYTGLNNLAATNYLTSY